MCSRFHGATLVLIKLFEETLSNLIPQKKKLLLSNSGLLGVCKYSVISVSDLDMDFNI